MLPRENMYNNFEMPIISGVLTQTDTVTYMHGIHFESRRYSSDIYRMGKK